MIRLTHCIVCCSRENVVDNISRSLHLVTSVNGLRMFAQVHIPNFVELSGSEDRGGGDNNIEFINIGRVGDKSLKNDDEKWEVDGWMMTFLCYWIDRKLTF